MKYRFTALIILLSLVLAACSLAEDITPPPGYQSPTSGASDAQITSTPQATWTPASATATPEITPITTQSTTPSVDANTTPGASQGQITGTLVNGSGGNIPQGQKVTLEGFDKDSSGSYQKAMDSVATVDTNGTFSFTGVEAPVNRAFIAITSWGGVEYQSDPVIVTDTTKDFSIPITIYEKTDDFSILTFTQVHLIFDPSTQNIVQVTELFIVTNTSKQVVVVQSDGTSIPFIKTPKNASGVQYQLSQGSAQLLNATGGFAIVPGADKQYGFVATYSMPASRSLKFDQPFTMPVASITVFVPQGMSIRGEQLTDEGLQVIQGQSYQMYQANNMASGSTLSMTLSGKPGATTGFTLTKQTWVLIGVAVVGVLLVGLGITLYLRDRARLKTEEVAISEDVKEDAVGEDSDSIMDAMIALDDQFKAGEIPKEAYEERRSQLKQRLKAVL